MTDTPPRPDGGTPSTVHTVAQVHGPTIAVRSYFSTHFLSAAKASAEAASRNETAAGEIPRFSLEHRGNVLSAIIHSVTFMEAAINEVLQDAAEQRNTAKLQGVGEGALRNWAALWEALDAGYQGSTLSRYQAALLAANRPRFATGAEPWQSAYMLVRLRNHLIHFRPEWVSAGDPQRLATSLSSKVDRNPLSNNEWDLDGWLSGSCAMWAARSAEAFVKAFADCTGAQPNYLLTLESLRLNNP